MFQTPRNLMRNHLQYSSSYLKNPKFSSFYHNYMGILPIFDQSSKFLGAGVAFGIGMGVTRPLGQANQRQTALKSFKENIISAKTFSAEYYEAGGNIATLNNEIIHGYKTNPKIRRSNEAYFDLEKTGNRLGIIKTAEIWKDDHLVLFTANQVETVIYPLAEPSVKKNNSGEKYGSVTNSNFDYLNQPNRITSQKNQQYYLGQQSSPHIISHISSGNIWNTPIGPALLITIPGCFFFLGSVVYNRIFNGNWIKPSSQVVENPQVEKKANLLIKPELENDKSLLKEKDEIILLRRELSDQSILYSVPTYDVFFPISKENKSDPVIIRKNISEEEAISMINDLSNYGVFMAVSKNAELEK